MQHAVHYLTSGGEQKFDEAASLEAAVAMVEQLRNEQGATEVRVFRQVPIEFKAYYKVAVLDEESGEQGGGQLRAVPSAAAVPSAPPPPAPAPAPAPAAPAASEPPPGSMLSPATVAAPAAPAPAPGDDAPAPADDDDAAEGKRSSLFSRS